MSRRSRMWFHFSPRLSYCAQWLFSAFTSASGVGMLRPAFCCMCQTDGERQSQGGRACFHEPMVNAHMPILPAITAPRFFRHGRIARRTKQNPAPSDDRSRATQGHSKSISTWRRLAPCRREAYQSEPYQRRQARAEALALFEADRPRWHHPPSWRIREFRRHTLTLPIS
jgi:hypothetical protein